MAFDLFVFRTNDLAAFVRVFPFEAQTKAGEVGHFLVGLQLNNYNRSQIQIHGFYRGILKGEVSLYR